MSSAEEEEENALQAVQKILNPYIRPREEVAHIRRVLALHLDSCLKDGSATAPLALVETSEQQKTSSAAARGLYKEYLDALSKNMKAREEYKACVRDIEQARESNTTRSATAPSQDPIRDHLATISLQKKKERLHVLEQHINLLEQKPAASPSFLDPEEMFRYSRPLPEVPKEVVNSLVTLDDSARPSTHLKDLINQLEKHVLRTKLLLKREEQLLEEVKQRRASSSSQAEAISESAKFEALNATRIELINWIETELGKASGGEESSADQDRKSGKSEEESRRQMDQNLASIKEKYAKYSEARKALLLLVSQQPRPTIKPQNSQDRQLHKQKSPTPPSSAPSAHLLSPYLAQLLNLSHTQKSLISQKSHLNTTITKTLRENAQHLDRLAEESQLIPAHPMPGGARRKPASGSGGASEGSVSNSSDSTLDTSSHVKPWVFAADSAKIATLEAVAEQIEQGQMALEASMRTIGEMEMLLGVNQQSEKKEDGRSDQKQSGDATADDIWLAEEGGGKSRRSVGAGRTHNRTSINNNDKSEDKAKGDVWSLLDGNLGLLGGEESFMG
ncbi:hypothetical protein V8F20_009921 [Naviculisporaceae sp. PSN 640]